MERAALAAALGAPAQVGAAAASPAPVRVRAADVTAFRAALAAGAAGAGPVFLEDPSWGESENAQVEALVAAERVEESGARRDPERGWLMIPTGGTSGRIKFARHDGATLAAAVSGFRQHFGLDRVNALGLLPLHHVSGLMAWLRCALSGGDYVPGRWKDIEAGARPDLPARPDGWVLSLVPTQLERLLRGPAAVAWLRGFRIIFLGGAPAWPDLLDRAAAARLPLALSYGMTETAAMVTALRPEEFLAGARHNGTALPHARVSLTTEGLIAVAGASVFRGYWPEVGAGGAFVTADLGALDAAGALTVLGRRDGVIITGGEKVHPEEVEAVLRGTGEFADVVVLGRPHAEWGREVVAVHPAGRAPDWERVRSALARQLAPAKRPKRFVAVADWPVTAAGKVNRGALAARLAAE